MLIKEFINLLYEAKISIKSREDVNNKIIDILSNEQVKLHEDDIAFFSKCHVKEQTVDYKIFLMANLAKIDKNFKVLEYILCKLLINSQYIENFKKFITHDAQEDYLKPFLDYLLNSKVTYIDASTRWKLFSEMIFNECFKNNRDYNNISIINQQTHNIIKNHILDSFSVDNNQNTMKQIIDELKCSMQNLTQRQDTEDNHISSLTFMSLKNGLNQTNLGNQIANSETELPEELTSYTYEICATGVINYFLESNLSSFTL